MYFFVGIEQRPNRHRRGYPAQLDGLLVGIRHPVGGHDLDLGGDPHRLGVGHRPIEVPQHGSWSGLALHWPIVAARPGSTQSRL
ncbi:hypothetical protein SDC9_195651 [bioreactor metagenome]|uniref:Uncharacterized protein n=1 Tax=bioreactor metagenome TaxID=1076179 RepID=A0A645I9M9_9ZZZZ